MPSSVRSELAWRAVHHHHDRTLDETHDVHDQFTFQSQQRQQQAAPNPNYPPYRPSSALDNHPRLRRTSRYSPRRPGSVDASGRPFQVEQTIPVLVRPATEQTRPAVRPTVSETRTEEDSDLEIDDNIQPNGAYWPRRTSRVSSHTASAILWTLEEAIRRPFPFTPDWDEVNASMADIVGPAASGIGGNGRSHNGASKAAQGPIPVNPHPASGVRTPTDIMRQRRDREARKKAEQEAKDREQEAAELRQLQQEQARVYAQQAQAQTQAQAQAQAQAQQQSAGVAGDRPTQRRAAPGPSPTRPTQAQAQALPTAAPVAAPQQTSQSRVAQPQVQPQQQPSATQPQPQSAQQSQQQAAQQQPRRPGFPHAFERWETLSSHWEGLTSYWIRKLKDNNETLESDPINQQMARQVTDLSAAGANLFHAVVELQRLRASSERKFQRWFFDTRAEQERSKELQGELERQVRVERQARTEAVAAVQKAESDKARIEDMLKEMRRELQISKDEARRAWEELGRREQEERDRTNSLRNGEPTLVGGVQVVPMISGMPRRDPARPPTREGPYTGDGKTTSEHLYGEIPVSPVGTDPFVEGQRSTGQGYPPAPEPPTSQSQSSYTDYYDPAYQPHASAGRDPSIGSSEPGDDYGYQQNPQAMRYPPAMSEGSDDYDQASQDSEGYPTSTMPPSSGAHYAGYDQSVDYSGSGWGVGSGWESMTPRHRHPTRLSDVLEEEEPRTTPSRASRASQASRSIH
ncbi:hypothetical protein BDW69DRAFT_196781 [Aspergillus filifer]